MTKQELLEELRQANVSDNIESRHLEADRALLAYIDDEEITNAYTKIQKWYA